MKLGTLCIMQWILVLVTWVVEVRFFVKFKVNIVAVHLWNVSFLRNFLLTKKIFLIVVSNVFIPWQYFVDFSKQTLSTWKALYHHQKNKGVKTSRFISPYLRVLALGFTSRVRGRPALRKCTTKSILSHET